jgi:outer membrane protein
LRDAAVLRLRKNNIAVLREQLRVTRDRQEFGEVTRTDVAQADAALAQAESEFTAAEGALQNSKAVYEQVIGEAPARLEPPPSLEGLIPISRDDAIEEGLKEHPSVVQALHEIDAAESAVKVAEAQLMPTASVGAQIIQQYDSYFGYPGTRQFGAQALAQLNVPLYQGGGEYSGIRQAKEQLGQARIHLNTVRNAVRAAVVQGYTQFITARAELVFNVKAVKAAETALKGIRDEAAFGQRTTFDVLNAQQKLVEARVDVITAQRNIIVGSYATLAAMGRLSVAMLGLDVAPYDPAVHLEEVKGKWFGVSTPAQP